jgi:hypothetical protein
VLLGTNRYVGFSVFGPQWPMERDFATLAERLAHLEEQGYLVAQYTSQLYGNLVRVPISLWDILGRGLTPNPELVTRPVYQLSAAEMSAALDAIQTTLDAGLEALDKGQDLAGRPLHWELWDAFFSGIQRYNTELESQPAHSYRPVFVDLLLTDAPPALIIEAPPEKTLHALRYQTSGERLWGAYRQLHLDFIRLLVRRYARGYASAEHRAVIPIAVAIEMLNEPD